MPIRCAEEQPSCGPLPKLGRVVGYCFCTYIQTNALKVSIKVFCRSNALVIVEVARIAKQLITHWYPKKYHLLDNHISLRARQAENGTGPLLKVVMSWSREPKEWATTMAVANTILSDILVIACIYCFLDGWFPSNRQESSKCKHFLDIVQGEYCLFVLQKYTPSW